MANFNSVNQVRSASVPLVKIPPGQIKGQVLFAYDEYTSLANLGAADTITTGIVIPAGCKVKTVTVTSPTNGGTMSVGISGSATKYVNAASAAATTATHCLLDAGAADEQLIITMGAATATGLYKIAVEFIKV